MVTVRPSSSISGCTIPSRQVVVEIHRAGLPAGLCRVHGVLEILHRCHQPIVLARREQHSRSAAVLRQDDRSVSQAGPISFCRCRISEMGISSGILCTFLPRKRSISNLWLILRCPWGLSSLGASKSLASGREVWTTEAEGGEEHDPARLHAEKVSAKERGACGSPSRPAVGHARSWRNALVGLLRGTFAAFVLRALRVPSRLRDPNTFAVKP